MTLSFWFIHDTDTCHYTGLKLGRRSKTGREKRVTPEFGERKEEKIPPPNSGRYTLADPLQIHVVVGSEHSEGPPNAVVQRPAESTVHMAAQGPQMTLGGATRGDAVEAKGLAESRDGLGHGHTVGLLLLSRLGKCLVVLDGFVKSRFEPCRQQDNILQTQGEEWRQKQSHRAGKTYLRPGHAAVRPWLG
jgi:hypothetical protein